MLYNNHMITFDSLTLKAFTEEAKDFLEDARIQKIQQPTRRDFVFSIRKGGETRKLYININPQIHHICFMSKENELRRRIEIPQKPPMFCMLLRKYLENSRICKINQPQYERILELYVETYNEINEKIYLCLAIELMGKHSNVILYNDDTNVILGCAHNVGAEKSQVREMAGTLPYTYPPKQNKIDILNYNGEIDFTELSRNFYWFSTSFAKQCEGKNIEKLRDFVQLKALAPKISSDYKEFSLFEELIPKGHKKSSVNEMIDDYFTYWQEDEKFKSLKTHLLTLTHQKLKRTKTSIEKMQSQIIREENCDQYRLFGDLIMANLWGGKDYTGSIEVFDYENNQNITIQLDETKTLKENAQKFYKQYNKGKTSKQKLTELSEELIQTKEYLEQIEYSLLTAKNYDELAEIRPELIQEENSKAKISSATMPDKIIKNDFTIYIGKNNKQNDYIVSKLAKDEDLWFHTRNCAGSHVLLRGTNPSDELILECAKIAKQYSSGSTSTKIGVIYTKCKYLKKPPKANLGYVTYSKEKEIIID